MKDSNSYHVNRRRILRTIGMGAAVGAAGIGAFGGTAAAWDRQDVDFKGCSEVWIIVGADDVHYDPPTVAHVVFALEDGTTECRAIEFTPENTTHIPGQYGDAPIRKVTAGEGEKILGVIIYNYRDDQFSQASKIFTNDHRCANTPGTPSMEDASCTQAARESGGYDGVESQTDNGKKGRSKRSQGNAKGGKP